MRSARTFGMVLAAALLVAGCGDSKKVKARNRLREEIDLARKCYESAISMVANPVYVDKVTGLRVPTAEVVVLTDGTRLTGEVTKTEKGYRVKGRGGDVREVLAEDVKSIAMFETPAPEVVVSTQPAEGNEADELLDRARSLVLGAIDANPGCPVGVKADAQQLLGDIESARGTLFATTAERLRNRASGLRRHGRALIGTTRNHAILQKFNSDLANMSREKILEIRDKTQKEQTETKAAIKTIDDKIAALQTDIGKLVEDNAKLTAQSRAFRDAHEKAVGKKRLDLVKQAQERERKRNHNQYQVQTKKDEIDTLLVDKGFSRQKLLAAEAKLALAKKFIDTMDERKWVTVKAMESAKADVKRTFKGLEAVAGRIVKICKDSSQKEAAALTALGKAIDHFGRAEKLLRTERAAAQKARQLEIKEGREHPSRIIAGLADDKHIAALIASKASAGLTAGEVASRQLATAKGNIELADGIATLAKELGMEPPPVVVHLKAYLADEAKTTELASNSYQQAEKDLEGVLDTQLKDSLGQNIRWIYQGHLADMYMGHYRLTNDGAVLDKARKLVAEAAKGKEQSPHLRSVLQLKWLIESAGG